MHDIKLADITSKSHQNYKLFFEQNITNLSSKLGIKSSQILEVNQLALEDNQLPKNEFI